jgi:hypothetical protein
MMERQHRQEPQPLALGEDLAVAVQGDSVPKPLFGLEP